MKTTLRIVAEVAVLAAIVWFGARFYLGRSVARQDGRTPAPVAAPVEVTFDEKGIPQVWAKTDADAYFAMGWLHASDRLFQMELLRRLAHGELAEVFGKVAFQSDVQQRRMGFRQRAGTTGLTPAARLALEKYVAGINAWVAEAPVLPPEFLLMRIRPRPWTIEDCLTVAGYQTWYSHQLMDHDKAYRKVIASLGVPGTMLAKTGHPWSPPTVPANETPAEEANRAFLERVVGVTGMRVTTASNSWVVSASRSSTRAALHAADPHLAVDEAPGIWYLAGIHSEEGLNVVGATYAGAPFVLMGHNGRIAFSFTVAAVDLVDTFIDEPRLRRREEIVVRGEPKPRVEQVLYGARGVMVGRNTSLRWAGFDFPASEIINSAMLLQRAIDFDQFRAAVTRFGALDANWVYSDRAGNIGYQLGAPLPIRDYETYVVQRASDPRTAWKGYRRLQETPWALNPPAGFLASCNNQIVPETWPYAVPGFYDPYRITRATALLQSSRTPEEMRAMQLDLVSGVARRWKRLAAEGARVAGLQDAAAALEAWDGAMSAGSREAALFAFWWRGMAKAVFQDELGREWEQGRHLLDQALTIPARAVDDTRTVGAETAQDLSARAMREAHALARGRTWGEVCTLDIRHPLSGMKLLDRFLGLSRGTFAGSGDAGSLNANFASFDPKAQSFRTRVGPSMRFVLDWSDVDSFALSGVLGQSGNPLSGHYDDFLESSRKGEAWNVPFSREKVWSRKVSQLTLQPK